MTNKKILRENAGFFIFKDILMMWYNMDVGNLKLKGMEYDEERRGIMKNYFLKVFS
ncbi:hypothetical protein ACT7DA_15815 [Bacillus pacificus]